MAEDPKTNPDPAPDPKTDPKPDPKPDPQATIADLNRQLEAATGSAHKALEVTKGALRTANPDLPDAVFAAEDLDALLANVEAHKQTAAHIRDQITANGGNPQPNPLPPGAGVIRHPITAPANARGINRIAFALNNPGPGTTE